MACIWCCQAKVTTKEPLNVPGYSGTENSVPVKVRTSSEREPTGEAIIAEARTLMDACYTAEVLDVSDPVTNFILWDKI